MSLMKGGSMNKALGFSQLSRHLVSPGNS